MNIVQSVQLVLISNLGTLAITPSGSSDSRHGGSVLVNVNLFSNENCLSGPDEKREVLIKMQLNFQSFRSQFNQIEIWIVTRQVPA